MALAFSAMISRLSADERKLLDNTFAKYPDLKEDWVNAKEDGLRQAEFSRKLTEIDARKTEFEKEKSRNETLEALNTRNADIWDRLATAGIVDSETGNELWTAQKEELQRQLDEAKKSAVGGEMDAAELDRRVKEIVKDAGITLSKDEMNALIQNEGKKLAQETFKEEWAQKETTFNTVTIPFVWGGAMSGAIAAMKYEKETGKPWSTETTKELFELMTKKQNFDALSVLDEFIEPIKKAKVVEDKDAEIASLKQQLKTMPGGGGEGMIPQPGDSPEAMGALQRALLESKDGGDIESKIQEMAVKSAQELVAAR